jgi:hypothetical protein
MRNEVWEHFDEVEARANAKAHPTAQCKFCGERVRGQPKSCMIPHLLTKCPQVSSAVKLQLQEPQRLSSRSSRSSTSTLVASSNLVADETSDVDLEPLGSVSAGLELVARAPETHSATQLQCLELLRLKAKANEYRAKAMEAQFMAERLEARIRLQERGVPDNEIERSLPTL